MLVRIGGQFRVEDYFVNKNNITIITNIKPDFNILRNSKSLEVTPMVKTAKVVQIAPKTSDFLYIRNRAVSSGNVIEHEDGTADVIPIDEMYKEFERFASIIRGANDNGDFFSDEELQRTYKSFIGKATFVDHDNENVEKARGIILDAVYNDKGKYVELLKAVDRKAYPELARAIEQGYVNCTSMGCRCGYSICSICGNEAHSEEDFCQHILNYKGSSYNGLPVFEDNREVEFFEDSFVTVGADPQAKVLEKVASLHKVPTISRLSKNKETGLSGLRTETNQRSYNNQVSTLSDRLKNLPWS